MSDYLIRFVQAHESFRRPEIEAVTRVVGANVELLEYETTSPFCIVRFVSDCKHNTTEQPLQFQVEQLVRSFASLSILSRAIYELWGCGSSYATLHADTRKRSTHLWEKYRQDVSFKFTVDSFSHTRSEIEKRAIINEFAYLGFEGRIDLKRPDVEFGVFEEWVAVDESDPRRLQDAEGQVDLNEARTLKRVYLGRKIGISRRQLIEKHDLKKRPYISTTSMDAELALVTANLALATPGKLFLDPFVGTGGFMLAAAELGAVTLGSDIDGRSFRGKGAGMKKGVGANFSKYGLTSLFGDCITSDLTNTPFRDHQSDRWLDGIICDPPYGVREGLKVLGARRLPSPGFNGSAESASSTPSAPHLIDGIPAYTLPGYIAPKRPYSFDQMLDDILNFAARTLVDGGRLAFWMPSANENEDGEEELTVIPSHPAMELKHECVQRFNRWSRRLLVYERIAGPGTGLDAVGSAEDTSRRRVNGTSADELNPFRKRYFQAFAERPND